MIHRSGYDWSSCLFGRLRTSARRFWAGNDGAAGEDGFRLDGEVFRASSFGTQFLRVLRVLDGGLMSSNTSAARKYARQAGRRSRRYKDKSPDPKGTATSATKSKSGPGVLLPWPVPQHVRQCHNRKRAAGEPIESQDWWIWSWRKDSPEAKTRRPYTCGSWRCAGACATHAAHVLFSRLDEATSREHYQTTGWVFAVLTLDRLGTRGGKPWSSVREAYLGLGQMAEKTLKRWRRLCERRGWGAFGSDWAMVVEAHRSGWPHVNLLLYAPELAEALASETRDRELAGFRGRDLVVMAHQWEPLGKGIRGELGRHAVAAGWGIESTAERADSTERLSGYLVKLSAKPDETLGEIAKLTQLPLGAPFRFRRLRSGKGFLPKERANPAYTGALVKRVTDQFGCRDAIVPVPKAGHAPARAATIELVERLELFVLSEEDRAAWARLRGRPVQCVAVPPVSLWLGEVLQRSAGPPGLAKAQPSTWDEFRAAAYQLSLPVVSAREFVNGPSASVA